MKFKVVNEDWKSYLYNQNSDKETNHKAHLIMVDELGDEVDVGEFSFYGDEDGWEIYKERKILKMYNKYSEARDFYFEDRSTWGRTDAWYEGRNQRLEDFMDDELIPDLEDSDIIYTEDDFAKMLIDRYGFDDEEEIEGIIETVKEMKKTRKYITK